MRAADLNALHGSDAWVHPRAVTAWGFKRDRYFNRHHRRALEAVSDDPRAGSAFFATAAGAWKEFATNELARLNGVGAAFQGQFTNKIRNPRGEGGVVGTVGVLNKCFNYNATPTDATGLAVGANVSLSYPDWTTSLEALAATDAFISAGLTNGFLSGKVVAAHNSDVVERRVIIGGATGNTNPASAIIYLASSGGASRLADAVSGATLGSISTSSSTLQRFAVDGFTPASSSSGLAVYIEAGATAYFILNHLQEASAAAPVPTIVAGASATGALPTNWGVPTAANIKLSFLGTGSEYGLPYSDVRFSGTATGAVYVQLTDNVPVTPGQAWGMSYEVKTISGTSPQMKGDLKFIASGGAYVSDRGVGTQFPPSASKQYFSGSMIIYDAAAVEVRPQWYVATINGTTYDFVSRIYAPKLCNIAVVTGAEGVSNPGPFTNTTGYTGINATISAVSNNQRIATTATYGRTEIPVTCVIGAVYLAATNFVSQSTPGGGFINVRTASGSGGSVLLNKAALGVGAASGYFVATGATQYIQVGDSASGVTDDVSSISVKQVSPGYLPTFPILPPVGTPGDSTRYADNDNAVQAMEGPELISNPGGPFTDTTGYTSGFGATLSISGTSLRVYETTVGVVAARSLIPVATVPGKAYRIKAPLTAHSGAGGGMFAARTSSGGNQFAYVNGVMSGTVTLDFVALDAVTYIGPGVGANGLGNWAEFGSVTCNRLTPFVGWRGASDLGDEIVPNGGFDVASDVNDWTVGWGTELISWNSGTFRIENGGTDFGYAYRDFTVRPGVPVRVTGQRVAMGGGAQSPDVHVGRPGTPGELYAYVTNGVWSNGPFYVVPTTNTLRVSIIVGGNTTGAWKQHDNVSVKEVEPDSLDNGFTVLATVNLSFFDGGSNRWLFGIHDGTANNRLSGYLQTNGSVALLDRVAGSNIANLPLYGLGSPGTKKIAFVFDPDGFLVAANGLATVTSVGGSLPSGLKIMQIGSELGSNPLNDIIEEIQVCRPLTQAEAEAWASRAA